MKNKTKRITFFINFIDSFGMTRAEFFRSISMNRNTYINWLNADDISLRKIFDICTRVKYRCSIYLEPKNEEEAEKFRAKLEEKYPSQDVNMLPGGQPVYYYIISLE